jgi:cyclophilin family peptidyl-prolyl cis-trans isomerase
MTIVKKRLLTVIIFIALAAGLLLLAATVFNGLALFPRSSSPTPVLETDTNDATPVSETLQVIDATTNQSSSNFNLETDLAQAALDAQLSPLKKSSDFITKTADTVTITTSRGVITIKLFPAQAPTTVTNFLTLIDDHFYDQLKFHRVEADFVVQVGDPASREASTTAQLLALGAGGPGYRIADEISPELSHSQPGIVAMANKNFDGSLPDSGGSQFYITLAPATYHDGRYSIFGAVTSGMDIVRRLQVGDSIEKISYQ